MTAPLSIEEIERLEALEKAATRDWKRDGDQHELIGIDKTASGEEYERVVVEAWGAEDLALIAALRNAAPRLLVMARSALDADDDIARLEDQYTDAHADWQDMRDDRDRYLAALKAEAIAKYHRSAFVDPESKWEVGGITFRVTHEAGELVAEEVQDV